MNIWHYVFGSITNISFFFFFFAGFQDVTAYCGIGVVMMVLCLSWSKCFATFEDAGDCEGTFYHVRHTHIHTGLSGNRRTRPLHTRPTHTRQNRYTCTIANWANPPIATPSHHTFHLPGPTSRKHRQAEQTPDAPTHTHTHTHTNPVLANGTLVPAVDREATPHSSYKSSAQR